MLRDLLQNLCSTLETDMGVSDKLKHSVELRTVWLPGKPGEEAFSAEIIVDRTVRIKDICWRTKYSDSPTKEIVEEQVFRRMIRMIFARGVIGVINADVRREEIYHKCIASASSKGRCAICGATVYE